MTDKRPLIIFGVAFILVLLLFLLFRSGGTRNDWTETYQENENPYGTQVIHKILNDYFDAYALTDIESSIFEQLPADSSDIKSNYVFVGEGLYMDSSDVNQLLAFVEEGNTAFISSKSVPYDLMFYVYYTECNDNYWDDFNFFRDTIGHFNFVHKNLKTPADLDFKYLTKGKTDFYDWNYIDSVHFCNEAYSFIQLGTINETYTNFAKIKYGQGEFFFHTNPIAFSNLQLLDEVGLNYSNKVFSHLTEGPIYWDTYSRVGEDVSRRRNQVHNFSSERSLNAKGPLSYILSEPPLAWAWYILIASALLYLFFRSKRTQRIIPVYEGNKNTSMEFISTIGSLYFMQNDHKKLCLQKMKLFLSYVRDRYSIATKEINEAFVAKLSNKSEINEDHIFNILKYYKNINSGTFVSDNTLEEFHKALEYFYKNRK
jgi:hypothetical protein